MASITKQYFIKKFIEKTGVSGIEANKIINLFIEEIKNCIKVYKKLKLACFGTFEVKYKKPRIGRILYKGQNTPFIITERNVVRFVPSRMLRK